ncbi:NUDIX hydrolase [Streptomyces orinoci]|uniref:NUDIX domain-containing protein n=1 Tax=Streptomyces orinoci TaxID=67339 RepID=A0ABV3K6Y3_STRON|nr:NUDIX domain-containing protein [Streptomyces orinoci]
MRQPPRYRLMVHVLVLMVRDDGRVLLLRRAGNVYASGLLCPPGGHLEDGETVTAGALREVAEEVGVTIARRDLEFCHAIHHRSPESEGRMGMVFTAQRWAGQPSIREPDKCSQLVWAEPTQPPADCMPYTAAVLKQFCGGGLLSEHGWPAGGTA